MRCCHLFPSFLIFGLCWQFYDDVILSGRTNCTVFVSPTVLETLIGGLNTTLQHSYRKSHRRIFSLWNNVNIQRFLLRLPSPYRLEQTHPVVWATASNRISRFDFGKEPAKVSVVSEFLVLIRQLSPTFQDVRSRWIAWFTAATTAFDRSIDRLIDWLMGDCALR